MEVDNTQVHSTPISTRAARRRPRGRGIRVRTGCSACRQRHLKCDETQPICRACQKSARECTYPRRQQEAVRAVSRREDDVQPPIPAPYGNGDTSDVATGLADDNNNGDVALDEATARDDEAADQLPSAVQDAIQQSHKSGADGITTDRPSALEERVAVNHAPVNHASPGGVSVEHPATIYENTASCLPEEGLRFNDQDMDIDFPDVYDRELFGISPEASFGGWPTVSAEAASKWWFDLLAADVSNSQLDGTGVIVPYGNYGGPSGACTQDTEAHDSTGVLVHPTNVQPAARNVSNEVVLTEMEIQLVHHYVLHLSPWIDVTDPDDQFAVVVPDLAMRNRGLASAVLALSSLHLSLHSSLRCSHSTLQIDATMPVQYYNETLHYLQHEMGNATFLRSDELLATVLIISTFEMIETQTLDSAWENHLKGVFWIQRSQVIHGESEGLKKRIWWAWLRQDIWAAYRRRRQILSFYKVTRECATLGFWELVDRAVYLLGQCVNYASTKEEENGRSDIQRRVDDSAKMWEKLEEWSLCFKKHDRRLPASQLADSPFKPIWINPTAASLAVQVHHFAKLLLLEYTPAVGGMKELVSRQTSLQAAVEVICGIASCTVEEGATIVSTQCVFAAGHHVQDPLRRTQVLGLLQTHRERTGWPHYDIANELENVWTSADGVL